MSVITLTEEYQTATERSHIKNWLNETVGLRLDKANTNDDGDTTSIVTTVFTAEDPKTGALCRIDSARIMGQIASSGAEIGDTLVVTVVPHGKRGQVLAPPAADDKDAKTLATAFK